MAQVSYGTITITDTNDIEEIYTIYAGSSGDTQQDMPTWTYAAVTGGTIWKRDASLVTGDYIWQSIVITKSGVAINATNWEDFYNTPICITGPEGQGGQPGTPGKGISNITIQYCNYGSGEPANTGSHWQDTIPTYDSSKPNYWTKTTITYTVGDPFIKKVLDQGITDAVYNSVMANSIASNANENAQGALSQVTEVEQHLSVTDTNISALQSRLKKIWINENTQGDYVAGTYAASGIDGTTFATDDPSTFGYNTLLRHNQLALRYNTFNLTQLSTAALTFYRPTTINNQLVQGDRGLVINANGLDILSISNYKLSDDTIVDPTKIYYSRNNGTYTRIIAPSGNPSTSNYYEHDVDARLDVKGLTLNKGGIQAGSIGAGNDGYIYLSTEDYPLETFTKTSDSDIDNSKTYYGYSSANGEYIQVTNPIVSDIDSYYEREGIGLTIGGHTPANAVEDVSNIDPAWRQIIGSKFGVDSEGNLYANDAHLSNANVEGAITATSLKIGSTNSYDGVAAINISGYLIEIISDSTDVNDPEHTTYLYPILYHNGEKVVPEDYSHFLWYEEGFDTATAGDVDNLGRYLATYGHRYRVTYAFDDGAVEGGTVTQTLMVDPQKYITKINDYGITIHPEIIASNLGYVQIDGNGLKIKQTIGDTININNDIILANYGNTITIGQSNSKNVFIDSNGVNIKNGSIILSNFGDTITIGQSGNRNVFIDSNGVNIKSGSDTLANFGDTITLGQNTSGHTIITSDGLEIYGENGDAKVADLKDIITIGQEDVGKITISPLAFTAVNSKGVEGFKVQLTAPGIGTDAVIASSEVIYLNKWNNNSYSILLNEGPNEDFPIIKIALISGVWDTNWKQISSVVGHSCEASIDSVAEQVEEIDPETGMSYVHWAQKPLVRLTNSDMLFEYGTARTITMSIDITYQDSSTDVVDFIIVYDGNSTITLNHTENSSTTINIGTFTISSIFWVTIPEYSTALTAGSRSSKYSVGAFSATIGEELIATEEVHSAFGYFNADVLVGSHRLISSFGYGADDEHRMNAFAVGTYEDPTYSSINNATIYLGIDYPVSQVIFGNSVDYTILLAMRNLGWINSDFTNKTGSRLLVDYYDYSGDDE